MKRAAFFSILILAAAQIFSHGIQQPNEARRRALQESGAAEDVQEATSVDAPQQGQAETPSGARPAEPGRSAPGNAKPSEPGRPAPGTAKPEEPSRPAPGTAKPAVPDSPKEPSRPAPGTAKPAEPSRPKEPPRPAPGTAKPAVPDSPKEQPRPAPGTAEPERHERQKAPAIPPAARDKPYSESAASRPTAGDTRAAQEKRQIEDTVAELSTLSLQAILGAAEGIFLDWRPDWPAALPPDLFKVQGNPASISVSMEAPDRFPVEDSPDGTSNQNINDASPWTGQAAAAWQKSNIKKNDEDKTPLVRFPIFNGTGFTQGTAEYADGRLKKIRSEVDADGNDMEAEILEYDEGRASTVRLRIAADWYFVALAYFPSRVEETWYDADGKPLDFISSDAAGQSLRISFAPRKTDTVDGASADAKPSAQKTDAPVAEVREIFFNSFGLVSGISSTGVSHTARYNKNRLPEYLDSTAENAPPEKWRFQWDEAGRLVRLISATVEYRYAYRLDNRGNWIERREVRMDNLQGRLFPSPGSVVLRTIVYADE